MLLQAYFPWMKTRFFAGRSIYKKIKEIEERRTNGLMEAKFIKDI